VIVTAASRSCGLSSNRCSPPMGEKVAREGVQCARSTRYAAQRNGPKHAVWARSLAPMSIAAMVSSTSPPEDQVAETAARYFFSGDQTEEADAYRITYRHRAQRSHRTVGSTERLAAYWRVHGLLGLLLPHESSGQPRLETETGITGAGSTLRRSGRRADGPHVNAKTIPTSLVCREHARVRSRA